MTREQRQVYAAALVLVDVVGAAPPVVDELRWRRWWATVGSWARAAAVVDADPAVVAITAAACRLLLALTVGARAPDAQTEAAAVDELRVAGEVEHHVARGHQLALEELIAGESAPAELRPRADFGGYLSPTEIGRLFGVSAQRVGRTVTALKLRDGQHSRAIITRARAGKTVSAWIYSPAAVEQIRRRLERDGHL